MEYFNTEVCAYTVLTVEYTIYLNDMLKPQ